MQAYSAAEIDERFKLLSQYERRCLIRFLQSAETDSVPISDVVSHLQQQDPAPNKRDELTIALHHKHLPKLAAADAIQVDSSSETVRYNGDELLDALLETSEKYGSNN
jgi:hypothetical protein